jgi:hypothetical protein
MGHLYCPSTPAKTRKLQEEDKSEIESLIRGAQGKKLRKKKERITAGRQGTPRAGWERTPPAPQSHKPTEREYYEGTPSP